MSPSSSPPPACLKRRQWGSGSALKECELELVEHQANALQSILDNDAAMNKTLLRVFVIVRAFLVERRRVCYGGTAINNLLPEKDQFYDSAADIPDYDAYSDDPIQDSKDVVDALIAAGIEHVEAKAGVHVGTFKVYANFTAVLDLTEMAPDVLQCMQAVAVPDAKDGLLYCHPVYLRIGVHVELSRPMGDVSRWTKVVQRLALLDAAYPIHDDAANQRLDAALVDVRARWPLAMPPASSIIPPASSSSSSPPSEHDRLASAVEVLMDLGAVFGGALACSIYHALDNNKKETKGTGTDAGACKVIVLGTASMTPCMDVLVPDLAICGGKLGAVLHCAKSASRCTADIAAAIAGNSSTSSKPDSSRIREVGIDGTTGCRLLLFPPVLGMDLVPWHLEYVTPDGRRLLAVYGTVSSCYAYNELTLTRAMTAAVLGPAAFPNTKKKIRIANLDVAVSLLGQLAFVPRMHRPDALVSARILIECFGHHPLERTAAPWARFKRPCLGDQHGLPEIKIEKADMYDLMRKRGIMSGADYDRWFLKYAPAGEKEGGGDSGRRMGAKKTRGRGAAAAAKTVKNNNKRRKKGGATTSRAAKSQRRRRGSWSLSLI